MTCTPHSTPACPTALDVRLQQKKGSCIILCNTISYRFHTIAARSVEPLLVNAVCKDRYFRGRACFPRWFQLELSSRKFSPRVIRCIGKKPIPSFDERKRKDTGNPPKQNQEGRNTKAICPKSLRLTEPYALENLFLLQLNLFSFPGFLAISRSIGSSIIPSSRTISCRVDVPVAPIFVSTKFMSSQPVL